MSRVTAKEPMGLRDLDAKPKPSRKQMRKRSAKRDNPSGMFVSAALRQFARGKECQMKSETI